MARIRWSNQVQGLAVGDACGTARIRGSGGAHQRETDLCIEAKEHRKIIPICSRE